MYVFCSEQNIYKSTILPTYCNAEQYLDKATNINIYKHPNMILRYHIKYRRSFPPMCVLPELKCTFQYIFRENVSKVKPQNLKQYQNIDQISCVNSRTNSHQKLGFCSRVLCLKNISFKIRQLDQQRIREGENMQQNLPISLDWRP